MAASSPTVLLIECDGELLLSTDGGAHAHLIPGARGSPRVIAAPLGQSATILLGTLNYPGTPVPRQWPTSALTRTINDGNSWTRTSYPQRGAGFTDPQFTNGTDGWVIHGYPGGPADELLHTTNAGATFVLVPF